MAREPGTDGRRPGGVRDHRRPREGDDVPISLSARGARAAHVPDRRSRGRRLDRRRPPRARPRGDRRRRRDPGPRKCSTASPRACPICQGRLRRSGDVRAPRRGDQGRPHPPSSTSRSRPFLFGTVVKGLAGAGLIEGARVVVEKPFGHDLASARALAQEMHELSRRVAAPSASTTSSGRWAWARSSTCASPTRCSSRSGIAITCRSVQITMAERFRRRGPGALL